MTSLSENFLAMIWFRQSKKTKLRRALKRIEEMEIKLVTQRDFFRLRIAALKFRDCPTLAEKKKVEREIAGAEYRLSLIEKQMKYILIVRGTLTTALKAEKSDGNKNRGKSVSFADEIELLENDRKTTVYRSISLQNDPMRGL